MSGSTLRGAIALSCVALAAGSGATGLAAQAFPSHDVVHLGERWGTTVPQSFLQELARNPEAFEFEGRGFGDGARAGGPDGRMQIFGQYDGNVQGTFLLPVLLGYYPEAGVPDETQAAVQAQFFDGPNPTGTVFDYFEEASDGRVQLVGETLPWRATSLSQGAVTGGNSGLGGASRVGQFILELLVAADDGSIDWGRYDNDGPDGIPNSGDDDGYIDVLGVVHPTQGGECGGSDNDNRIWSHRWSLSSATGQSYVTASASANGGFIRANDYTIQPVRNCANTTINTIGVFAHELGHGFGLPDLYGVGGAGHSGIGTWGLMGSGSWGCANSNAARPCMPGAWTREQLGWGTFIDLAPETDHGTLSLRSPAEGGAIYRYRVPETSTYFLLEYRDRTSFDGDLHAEGMLIWQIDEQVIATQRRRNRVNGDPNRMGVWVRQADGLNGLGDISNDGNRGDAGDPFPGTTGQTEFHAASTPASRLFGGDATFLTISEIELGAGEVTASVSTQSAELSLSAVGASGPDLFTVDGITVGSGYSGQFAPFESVEVSAGGGTPLAPGTRQGFERWLDGPTDRTRTIEVDANDVTLTAEYGTPEYEVSATLDSPVEGVSPGAIGATPVTPDLWFRAGTEVVFEASADPGFQFEGWTGDLVGQPSPAPVTVNAPMTFEALFSLDFDITSPESFEFVAGASAFALLEVRGAVGAATWELVSGGLPDGLRVQTGGALAGTVLESGSFEARIRVRDARGLSAEEDVSLQVSPPDITVTELARQWMGSTPTLTTFQRQWLDNAGNGNGDYDLGDAFLYLRNGGAR